MAITKKLMRVKLIFLSALILMLIGMTSAMTIVHVKTLPLHTVFLTPLDVGQGFSLMPAMQGFSNEYGDVVFEFELEELTFDLFVLVKNGPNKAHSDKILAEFESNSEMKIEVLPEGVLPIETPEEKLIGEDLEITEEIVEEDENSESLSEVVSYNVSESHGLKGFLLNGYSVIQNNKSVAKIIYYSLIGLTVFFIFFFIYRRKGNNVPQYKNKKIVKTLDADELTKAEEELKNAQKKVEALKNKRKDSLEEAKKRLLEAEKEIMRIRGVKVEESKEVTTAELKKRLLE